MGRTRIDVSQEVLVNTINDAENEQAFASRSALFAFVAEVMDVEPHTIANRVREWNIPLKTALGKRGRPAGSTNAKPASAACSVAIAPSGETPDFSDLLAAFKGAGIEVKSSIDIMCHRGRTLEENRKIRDAWATLRQILDIPWNWPEDLEKQAAE